jgi:uncharacterized protein (TIGR00255 family)
MLRSMTGFGRGEAAGPDVTVVVELRSVNNRYLDVNVRAPREYMPLEQTVVRTVKGAFRRGRVDAHIKRAPKKGRSTVVGDATLYRAYMEAIRGLVVSEGGVDEATDLRTFVLRQPGVLEVTQADVDVMSEADVLSTAVEAAVASLKDMREREGAELYSDMEKHLLALLDHLDAVEAQLDGLQARLTERLERRVTRLIGERHEPWRLLQEVGLLAERADISEEIARLRSHVLQFKDALEGDEAVGRRLDFLVQEMNREVNTIGSKATEHPVSHRVVDMKALLERIREQAANVE